MLKRKKQLFSKKEFNEKVKKLGDKIISGKDSNIDINLGFLKITKSGIPAHIIVYKTKNLEECLSISESYQSVIKGQYRKKK